MVDLHGLLPPRKAGLAAGAGVPVQRARLHRLVDRRVRLRNELLHREELLGLRPRLLLELVQCFENLVQEDDLGLLP